jgi:hypothetical protein
MKFSRLMQAAVFAATLAGSQATTCLVVAQDKPAPATAAKPLGLLQKTELEKLIPPSVYFQGQAATVQVRNSGGVRFSPTALMFVVKVDTGGYSTSIQERYQDYLITETPLLLGESSAAKTLPAGAYGVGFVADGLVVMDIGGNTIFTIPTQTDADLRRPSPLQVLSHTPTFRLYSGRTYVTFTPAP